MTPNDESDAGGHPFCFRCGYDLTGLTFPRPCPECGFTPDSVQDVADAREWFAAARRWFWFIRPAKSPAGLFHVLHDARSVRIARRRRFFWIWLPALLSFMIVLFGIMIVIESGEKVWYFDENDPDRIPVCVTQDTDRDRLFYFELDLDFTAFGFLFQKPASWVRVVEHVPRHVVFDLPEAFDAFSLFLGGTPLFFAIFGYLPALIWIERRARRRQLADPGPSAAAGAAAAFSLTAPFLGAALWVWLALLAVYGAGVLFGFAKLADEIPAWMVFGAGTLWFCGAIVGCRALIALDGARLVFPRRSTAALVLLGTSIGLPSTLFVLLGRFL